MRIFLSYASERRTVAEAITFALRGRGHEVFLDKSDLPPGGNYDARIERAIEDCDLMIFLVSPESVAPERFTLSELSFARHKWPSARGRVLPVMVAPTPVAAIPAYLTSIHIMQPEGNVAAEVASVVQRMAPRARPERLLPAALGIGLAAAIASMLPIPKPVPDAVETLLPGPVPALLKAVVFVGDWWQAPYVFALGIMTILVVWGRFPGRCALLVVPGIVLGWAAAFWIGYGLVLSSGAIGALPEAKACERQQIGSERDEDGDSTPIYRPLADEVQKVCDGTRTYAAELDPLIGRLRWHVFTLAGLVAGFAGSALTAIGLAAVSERFRTLDASGTILLTGTVTGIFLNPKLFWIFDIPMPGLLFIVWQAAVAVAIARTLTREAT